jgi:hypothetical protein
MGKKTVAELLVETSLPERSQGSMAPRETHSTGSPIPTDDKTCFITSVCLSTTGPSSW